MFQRRFAPLVESGIKCQTVRPIPIRMPKVGDKISLRAWAGAPYRSKQLLLKESVITRVLPVQIDSAITLNGCKLNCHEALKFSRADGFESPSEMIAWFRDMYGPEFCGTCIFWK